MDACVAVEKEVEKVLCKFTAFQDRSSLLIRGLYSDLENIKKQIDESEASDDCFTLRDSINLLQNQILTRTKEIITNLSTEHRDLHSSVSKVGKAIDKNFTADFACVSHENFFDEGKQDMINEVICRHYLREGCLNVAETLIKDTGIDMPEDAKVPFLELNCILTSLKVHDLEPALEWAKKNREKLRAQKSSLEFKLHRLAYITLISEGQHRIKEAIEYARRHLTGFVHQHEKAIQTLLGCLLYVRSGLENSPYADLLSSCQWIEICEVFTRDACALLGLSVESPLAVCINAGCTALPVLLNIKQVMQQQQVHNMWNSKEELPIEIDLGQNYRYHSIFACPILRQQSTESNPPMRLICGHIISRDALNKLTTGNKLKCPYCPVEQSPSDATHIYF
ncbi:UNVERIFIED_CONTAM: hypothetical protein RMT77_003152 [Armadillidium vulgare]|nr:Protein RMD5-like protein A [Armadillidium vulgare]